MTETEPQPLKAKGQPGGGIHKSDAASSSAPQVPAAAYDLRILKSLRRIIRAVDLHSRKLAMHHQVTGPQLACLLTISDQGPMTASALAREVHLSPSTIVGILDRLEQKGLVVRSRGQRDRRVVFLEVTERGRVLLASAPPSLQRTLAGALQGLADDEQRTIAAALEKIVAMMEADKLDAAPLLETGDLLAREPAAKKN